MFRRLLAGVFATTISWQTADARAQHSRWEPDSVWSGVEADVPVTLHLHLFELSFSGPSETFTLTAPVVTVGVDLRRPSLHETSLSLSFAQAPLALLLLGFPMTLSESPAVKGLTGFLLWLSGGTLRWTPGGPGNVQRSARTATSVALVLRNEFAVHPFVDRKYLRDTLGAGVVIRLDAPWTAMTHSDFLLPRYLCGLGVFASVAAERGGARSTTPGVWATCSTLFPWD
jgi:hypothetical protein